MDTQALWREFKRTEDPVRAKALRDRLILTYAPLVRPALLEDLGRAGDITADAIVPADKQSSLVLRARQPGVDAGRRLVVTGQMILDLVVIGAVVRLLTTAAKGGLGGPADPASPAATGEQR